MELLHGIFTVVKFVFGLGALVALLGIGCALLWYLVRAILKLSMPDLSARRDSLLSRLFLESDGETRSP